MYTLKLVRKWNSKTSSLSNDDRIKRLWKAKKIRWTERTGIRDTRNFSKAEKDIWKFALEELKFEIQPLLPQRTNFVQCEFFLGSNLKKTFPLQTLRVGFSCVLEVQKVQHWNEMWMKSSNDQRRRESFRIFFHHFFSILPRIFHERMREERREKRERTANS